MEYIELKEQIRAKLASGAELDGQQNLLEMGLDSLKIMRLVNQWRKQGIRLSFGELMEHPVLDEWWRLIRECEQKKSSSVKRQSGEETAEVKCGKSGKKEENLPFPLTDVQYAYKIGRADGEVLGGVGCHAYLEFTGREVSAGKLKNAWKQLMEHHPMLRARFLQDGTQVIMDRPYEERLTIRDLRNNSEWEKELLRIRRELSHRKLKVEEGQVAGISLSLLPGGETKIHFDVDLLVADVQSLQILLRDLADAYAGKALPETSRDFNFAKYLSKQKEEEKSEQAEAKRYWDDRLADFPIGPQLPLRKHPSEVKQSRFTRRILELSKAEWDVLCRRAAKEQVTPAVLLLTAYAMVLERWSRTKRFVLNLPFFNRRTEQEGIEDAVADFTTLLLLEIDMRQNRTVSELLKAVSGQLAEDMKHVAYSGVSLQRDWARLHGGGQSIAPVVFACNLGSPLVGSECKRQFGELTYMISQTPGVWLDFQVYEEADGIRLCWDSVDELFPEGMISDMLQSLDKVLHMFMQETQDPAFELLPDRQLAFLREQRTVSPASDTACLFTAFLEHVRSNPDKTAVIDTGEDITKSYGELYAEAVAVAKHLASEGIQRQPVALSLTRGYRQAVAALGILLSGNVYVPVSLRQPRERRQAIHEKTEIRHALTDAENFDKVAWPKDVHIWKLEELTGDGWENLEEEQMLAREERGQEQAEEGTEEEQTKKRTEQEQAKEGTGQEQREIWQEQGGTKREPAEERTGQEQEGMKREPEKEEAGRNLPEVQPEDAAYIIMTSGTTGQPKGAQMSHKGAWNTIADVNRRCGITADDRVLCVSAMDFDLSVYDLFGILGSGGTCVMIPEEKSRDAEFWLLQIQKYQITVWNSVPVLLDMLLLVAQARHERLPLRTVMLSGDWIGMDLPSRVAEATDNCRFIAMGGATEASIWSNYLEVRLPFPKEWRTIPYGRPLAHQTYRVVDEKGRDVPYWAEGELWIGGAGVGTYRGDPELTKRKFVTDEYGIWYRTGDKGRFWEDGTIEFLGREDFQVKIRGHRIELGEIEAALKSVKDVKNAVAEVSDGAAGEKQKRNRNGGEEHAAEEHAVSGKYGKCTEGNDAGGKYEKCAEGNDAGGKHGKCAEEHDAGGKHRERYLTAFLETGDTKREPLFQKDALLQEQMNRRWMALTGNELLCSGENRLEENRFKENQFKENRFKEVRLEEESFGQALRYAEQKTLTVMLETLQALGVLRGEAAYSYEEILSAAGIADTQRETVRRWLCALTRGGFVHLAKGYYTLLPKRNRTAEESFAQEKGKFDGIDRYFQRLVPHLPGLLQGSEQPASVYYAKENQLAPNDFLWQLPGADRLTEVLIDKAAALAAQAGRTFRIMELGTRDNRITKKLLVALEGTDTEYVYADSSMFFAGEARVLFAQEYPSAAFEALDLEKELSYFGAEGTFDCIVSFHALHRMHHRDAVLANIRRLLRPDGILLMTELTIQTCMQEMTATILEADTMQEMNGAILEAGTMQEMNGAILEADTVQEPKALLADAAAWSRALSENGFARSAIFPESGNVNGSILLCAMPEKEAYRLDTEYVISELRDKLPEYMIPKVYAALRQLPLSQNGKVDRKRLRGLKVQQSGEKKAAEPVTETEGALCEIWEAVFQRKGIGAEDNYYLLGGDSLLATQMMTKLEERFQIPFSIRDVMARPTIREQAEHLEKLLGSGRKAEHKEKEQITPDPLHEYEPFPLTDVQQAYWLGRSGMYELGQVSTHCYFELDAEQLDIHRLEEVWNTLIGHHGMMRAVILPDGRQQILRTVPHYHIAVSHLERSAEDEVKGMLLKIREEMSHQILPAESWPLFDVRVTAMPDQKYRIHVSFDNLIFDGWSMFRLLREWADGCRGKELIREPLKLSFRDYVLAIQKDKESGSYERDREYWLGRLNDFAMAPQLPLAKKEEDISEQKFYRREAFLCPKEWKQLKKLAQKYEVTPAVLLMTAYAETLRRWSVNADFTLNLTQFGKKAVHPQMEDLIGDFTTLTLLEIKNSGENSFLKRVRKVHRQLMEDLEHPAYSAVEFERELKKKTGNNKGSVMPIVFTSGLGIEQWNKGSWIGELVYNVSQTPQVWLDHQVVERDGGLGLFWDSVDALFYPGMPDQMFEAYVQLLRDLAQKPQLFEAECTSLVNVQISDVRRKANETAKEFPPETLDGLFLRAVKNHPHKEAVVTTKRRMTYEELYAEALFVSQSLKREKLSGGEIVAVLMEKGWEQIAAVYGILFAGAAYLPVDAHNPKQRIQKILRDSKVRIVLVQKELQESSSWLEEWRCLTVEGKRAEGGEPVLNQPKDLAYVIYTSGSTGMPKGVMITHEGAVNTIQDVNRRYEVTEKDKAIALSNLHFDLSVYDIFGVLGAGGTLVIPDADKVRDPAHWITLLQEEQITVWNSVPAFMEMLT
ncbi:MAG: AMP-binding protein [Lachnospiraceae bacterium]|nr:AMP-binding protein [Lachnospiraceae bacterium]